MSVDFLPFAILTSKYQCDSERIGDWRLASDRGGRALSANDVAEVATHARGCHRQLGRGAIREARRQPVEKGLDLCPAVRCPGCTKHGDGIYVGPQHLSRSRVSVVQCELSLVLPWQDRRQELVDLTHCCLPPSTVHRGPPDRKSERLIPDGPFHLGQT